MASEFDQGLGSEIQKYLRDNTKQPSRIINLWNALRDKAELSAGVWNTYHTWATTQIRGTVNWQGESQLVAEESRYRELIAEEQGFLKTELGAASLLAIVAKVSKKPFLRIPTLVGAAFFSASSYAKYNDIKEAKRILDKVTGRRPDTSNAPTNFQLF